jgi:predicted transcriptional regulator of viral defense system
MELIQELEKTYGYNEPILLNEINIADMNEVYIRQVFTRLVNRGKLKRFGQGVYYIPKMTPLGMSKLSAKKVYEKKYISDKRNAYGFYAGLTLENAIGITTQVPNIVEIVTNNEGSRLREVMIGNQKVRVRKSSVKITEQNVRVLQFLDLMNRINLKDMSEESKDKLKSFVSEQKLKREEVFQYIRKFPARTAKNVIESGVINELT